MCTLENYLNARSNRIPYVARPATVKESQRKEPKYHPAYWVGKTWINEKWINGEKNLELTSYFVDEQTKITDIIKIPF